MKRNIQDYQVSEDGTLIGVAKSVYMGIIYNPDNTHASGNCEFYDVNEKLLNVKPNIQIDAAGWGEDNNFIFQRFATQIGVVLI